MADELTFLHCRATPICTARVDKHFEGYYTLQFMDRGAVALSYDDRAFELAGRWFWSAFPGPRIRFCPASGHASWSHRYVAFRGARVNRWIAEGLFFDAPQREPKSSRCVERFDELIEQASRGGRWGTLRATNLLEQLLILLAEHQQHPAQAEPWLSRVIERLSESSELLPDYAAIAEQAGMSLSTLRRRFRSAMGVSIHAFALQCRMSQARRLLGETDLEIKRIARQLGYQDIYFFSKQFRQLNGIPPNAFRRSRQA